MSFKPKFAAFAIATLVAFPAFAEGIMIKDAYARTSGNGAKSGAAFMQIMNHTNEDDRLLNVSSDIAKKVELHTHIEISDGVMKMMHVEEGVVIPAGGMLAMKRGGDHVMFMGLTENMEAGSSVEVTFEFEKAGEMTVQIPVDLERQDHGDTMSDHSGHSSDN